MLHMLYVTNIRSCLVDGAGAAQALKSWAYWQYYLAPLFSKSVNTHIILTDNSLEGPRLVEQMLPSSDVL